MFTRLSYHGNDTFNFNLDGINRIDMTKKFWIGLIIVLIVALMGVYYQKFLKNPHCAYDGSAVTPIYEVDIVLKDKSTKKILLHLLRISMVQK